MLMSRITLSLPPPQDQRPVRRKVLHLYSGRTGFCPSKVLSTFIKDHHPPKTIGGFDAVGFCGLLRTALRRRDGSAGGF